MQVAHRADELVTRSVDEMEALVRRQCDLITTEVRYDPLEVMGHAVDGAAVARVHDHVERLEAVPAVHAAE